MDLVSLKQRLKYSNVGDECAEGSRKEDNKSNKQMHC